MLKLTWNTAKLGNLKCGAESPTNTEAIVDFSPLLKNMSKHGHCAATMINTPYIYFQYCFTVTCMAHRKCSEGICYFSFLKLFISTDFYLRYYQPGAWAVACICHTLKSLSLSLSSPNKESSSSSSSPPLPMLHFGSVLISTKINSTH